ncbi:MAG TPA: TetR/AcrR family transcriptional regulator [Verrucomicrobiae bacterium]|jgi:AcrR family transcriptional regulator|nr:TetR/AcrR family transcriptional regulator [Verrucomicrobiae bacterium]
MNTRSRPPGRRAVTAANLRTRLIDAAERLLAERQPGSITSREIARAAGVSDGVLYNHFADKNDLLLTALLRRFTDLVEAFAAGSREPGSGSVVDGVAELVERSHALQVAALPMLANLVGDPPLLQRFMVEIHRPPLGGDVFRRPVVDYLAAEQSRGRLGTFDPEAAADVLVGAVLMQGLIDVLAHRPAAESAQRLAAITSTLLSGLGPTTAGDRPSGTEPDGGTP